MLVNQLASKYAQAIYELAAEKNMLDQVENELRLIETTVKEYNDLATLLYHPRVLPSVKKETIKKIFKQEVADFVLTFLLLLVDKRREPALPAIIREYIQLANGARNIAEAEVTTAMPLSPEQHRALADKLSAVTGKRIILKMQQDKSIVGGVIVKIGDKLIDGSVVRQMQMLKNALLRSEVTRIGVTD
jgi:F-type H+-transporting ATPase subunit delta